MTKIKVWIAIALLTSAFLAPLEADAALTITLDRQDLVLAQRSVSLSGSPTVESQQSPTSGSVAGPCYLRFIVECGHVDSVTSDEPLPSSPERRSWPSTDNSITTFSGDDSREPDYYGQQIENFLAKDRILNPARAIQDRSIVGGKEILTIAIAPAATCSADADHSVTVTFWGSDDLLVERISSRDQFLAMLENGVRPSAAPLAKASETTIPEYLVVTSNELVDAFQPLIRWKTMKGLSAGIVRMGQVLTLSGGVDNAEKLRNFLIEMYNAGTRYVLLGGDETIVPVRYGFAANTASMPTIDLLQICDLYYGDVDGNWDVDRDGVYGEPTQDNPDLGAELLVGRLPVCTPAQVTDYVQKLIAYEQNPNNGNYAYLSRSLFVAADQMRDYEGVGQHSLLAQSLPARVVSDTSNLIEAPSGVASDPSYPLATTSIGKLAEGWGILSLLVHGRYDGWVIRSNQYNQWPKSFVLTASGSDGTHGFFPNVPANNMPGLVYSVGCNNGAFDMDTPPYPSANPSVATAFLTKPDGGAVAFVGYSRWGWVGTSWQFEQAFLDYLYNVNANPAEALNYAKLQFPYYRDECYGLNLDGDPEMKIWTDAPKPLVLSVPQTLPEGANDFELSVRSGSSPLAGAIVTVIRNDSIAAQSQSDANGQVTLSIQFNCIDTFTVVAYKSGYAVATKLLNPQLVLGTDDDATLPKAFEVFQNYPNPFNPATTISFQLDRPADVMLEIYNILGEKVITAVNNHLAAGKHEVSWDGLDDHSQPVSSGIYFARIFVEDQSEVIKMCLMK
jgi:hypothetical protein